LLLYGVVALMDSIAPGLSALRLSKINRCLRDETKGSEIPL